ncbi:DUF1801 domain-containing protein [Gramella sp. GC03-9]|uniref:DUF1801 domain-containing protein n=1 Tax=Christiangramia oceanisediminis TaxID=2920386 RepID=A0A9X2KZC5_9FLAO|nr:DUF1801 domain-containing protein [Gramella oceanisediminis]MCP9201014.1 DUF1801 domain-containing protein [Gramella oceanisediminis]
MKIEANSPEKYISKVPEERIAAMSKLRSVIRENLPVGYEETMSYGMIGYVVPHSIYPDGYHCDPELPLPFMNLASQKNYIALYHSGVYANKELSEWFIGQYKTQIGRKPDMGKSCIRFKKPEEIPFVIIGELVSKMNVQQWIDLYEKAIKK